MVFLFILILYCPTILQGIGSLWKVKTDVTLLGFTDSAVKPELSAASYWEGTFQNDYSVWYENQLPLRGVYTKTYNTLRFMIFHLGNRPIGKDDFIFETSYLNAELAIGGYDYSIAENIDNMKDMVEHMSSVNEKLDESGKKLYVYIAPSKANIYPDNMPMEYVRLSQEDAVRAVDLFRELISQTSVPFYICSDMKEDLEYPAFYSTGIHWSRTYEQLATQHIINDLSGITKRNYRNIVITGVENSKMPFWRDTDVYDLLNVWTYPSIDYYQYSVMAQTGTDYEPLKMILFGDSFADGLQRDIYDNLQEDKIYLINRNNTVIDVDGNYILINQDWNNIDWKAYLDDSDVVVVEMTEPEIVNYTYGFIKYLDSYLDTYIPSCMQY